MDNEGEEEKEASEGDYEEEDIEEQASEGDYEEEDIEEHARLERRSKNDNDTKLHIQDKKQDAVVVGAVNTE